MRRSFIIRSMAPSMMNGSLALYFNSAVQVLCYNHEVNEDDELHICTSDILNCNYPKS